MIASDPPIIGALVEFFPGRGDLLTGIRPAMIERVDEIGGTATVALTVFGRHSVDYLRTGVIGEGEWLNRAATAPVFDSDSTPHWAWAAEKGPI